LSFRRVRLRRRGARHGRAALHRRAGYVYLPLRRRHRGGQTQSLHGGRGRGERDRRLPDASPHFRGGTLVMALDDPVVSHHGTPKDNYYVAASFKSDTTDLPRPASHIYVGTAGDLVSVPVGDLSASPTGKLHKALDK